MRMAGTGFGRFSTVGLPLLALVIASSCGGGDPGPMSGRQVLTGRDVGDLFFWKARTLAFTRDAADSSQPEPQDFFVWPLDEPAPTPALTGVNWTFPTSWPVWLAGDLLLTGSKFERLYDVGSRQAVNLLVDFQLPPEAGVPDAGVDGNSSYRSLVDSAAIRSDGGAVAKVFWGDTQTIIVGRPPDLRALAIPRSQRIGGMTFLGEDLALLVNQSGTEMTGVFRLDTSSGSLTPLVPATPASEWTGVTGFCDDSKYPDRCGYFGTIGCGVGAPACPSGSPSPCTIFYAKRDPDDAMTTAAYVYDVGTATSTKLAGADPDTLSARGTNHLLVWGSTTNEITRWRNLCSAAEGECPFAPGPLVTWRPDGGAFAMYGPEIFLNVAGVADGTCHQPDPRAAYGVFQAQYAPTNDRLLWVSVDDESARTLWLADGNAQSPAAVVGGSSLGAGFTSDGQHLYVSHATESNATLGWVDLAASPPVEQVLSTNRGDVGILGNRRVLFVDHFNAQDGNGELVLVELATGARQSLARAVTGVAVAGGTDAEGTDVAYSVRGRASASRDGLWLTTLPP
jgi:hypothetical protein